MYTELSSYLDAFIAASDEGSFSAAARRLGLTPAAVSKSVARLESQLGVRLFQRSTRSLALTTDGERLYGQVRLPWSEIGDALTDLRQGAGKPAGTLKVSMAHTVGRNYLVPLLDEFVLRYPDVVLDLHFDNRQVDLVAEGFDVGIGGGIELTEGLVARELSRVRVVLVASPDYLQRFPAPDNPAELVRHRGLLRRSLSSGRLTAWTLKNSGGQEMVATVRPVAVLDDPEAIARAAACGMGIAMLPLPHVLPFLESGELMRVLADWYADCCGLICPDTSIGGKSTI
ncbi:LysR family transcriptional regulator [Duganella violaceipulchra]|uniref:DNA-binding transcriptional LysR family regulator n=1 Tax=Duganella violaceipulchra TaxID=2849652 RepID=A0AA41LBU8_9BURK|nr:LysR family transcriptional regulator [Duganella violaceicalia]MBV6325690.1 LysR family transcriptional regulator [Duganella violaceicalia]MCP2012807.1 DNA-binding transcriptional LysR family regulator [Duganella violaceicalia]